MRQINSDQKCYPIKKVLVVLFISIFFNLSAFSQKALDNLTNVFEFHLGKETGDTSRYRSRIVLAPVVAYQPTTSLEFGLGTKLLFKPKKAGFSTRTSNLPISITYTLKNQFIFSSKYTIFFPEEKYLLKGAFKFAKFPVAYYGIGNNTRGDEKKEISFKNLLIEPLLLRNVYKNIFVGGGIRYSILGDSKLIKEPNELNIEFEDLDAISSGVELAISLDSRDNVLNAAKGNFIEFTHGLYDPVLSGTHKFMITKLDAREYYKPWPHRPDVFAFEVFGRFTWGNTPTLELSTLGGDELLRGFPEGRYRDNHAIFTQAEYRLQLLERFGMVFFAGAGDVYNTTADLSMTNLKYSLGTGLRLKIVRAENLNIRFDYGFGLGPEGDHNFYLGIAEAF